MTAKTNLPEALLVRTLLDLRPVLFKRQGPSLGPSLGRALKRPVYYVIRGVPNLTIILPGVLPNGEYPKTLGHYHAPGQPERYRVLLGRIGLLLQKPHRDGDHTHYEQLQDVRFLTGTAGEVLHVPEAYAHTLINFSSQVALTADWESDEAGHDYEPIKRLSGMGYYILRDENNNPKFVPNPNYKYILPL